MILTAINALMNADEQAIKDAYSVFTQYDAHIAVTLLAHYIEDLCEATGVSFRSFLALYRKQISAQQAKS